MLECHEETEKTSWKEEKKNESTVLKSNNQVKKKINDKGALNLQKKKKKYGDDSNE